MTDMKTIFSKLLIIITLITPPHYLVGQNDAFFYENYENAYRDGSTGFSFDNLSNGVGLGFGNFNDNLNGLNFGGFGNEGDGFDFGNFELDGSDVPLGNGLLLLTGFALLWRKRKAMSHER